MNARDTILHITLDTGDVRESPRGEVSEETLRKLRPTLLAAMHDPCVPRKLPAPFDGYALQIVPRGAGVVQATVYDPAGEAPVEIGVCAEAGIDRPQADTMWAGLCACPGIFAALPPQERPKAAVEPGSAPPKRPWCAVRLHPALANRPEAAAWLGDFERCLAWCWLERGRHGTHPAADPRRLRSRRRVSRSGSSEDPGKAR